MKKLILILALAICHLSLRGAETPQIEVISLSEVRIDGVNAGQLADVIANHRQLASAVQAAALQWQQAHLAHLAAEKAGAEKAAADSVAKANAEKEAAEKAAADSVAKATADKDAAEAKANEAQAKADELLAAVEVIDINGGALPKETKAAIKAARQSRAEKQRAEIEAKKAALEAQLAALSAK